MDWKWKSIMALDYKRAYDESRTKLYDVPKKNVIIAKSSNDVNRFLANNKNRKRVSIDIELFKGIICSIALSFNRHTAIAIPLLNVPAKDWRPISDREFCHIWKALDVFFKEQEACGLRTVGQNFKFDESRLRYGCGIYTPKLSRDNSLLVHLLLPGFPRSLAFQTSIWTRQPYYKEEGSQFNPKRDFLERYLNYNGLDACVTLECCEEIEKEIYELCGTDDRIRIDEMMDEMYPELHYDYIDIERVGLGLDKDKQAHLLQMYDSMIAVKQRELDELVGHPINVNSNPQMCNLLYNEMRLPKRQGAGEDVLVALLNNVVKKDEHKQILTGALELRRIRKTRSSDIGVRPDYDGRVRTAFNIGGTETGRSTTNKLKPPVRPNKMGAAFQTLSKHGDAGIIRSMYVPGILKEDRLIDDRYVFINWDLEQAEPRIVALLCSDYKTLNAFDTIDIHALTASWIFGGSWETWRKTPDGEPTQRFIGKTVRNGGNYDAQKKRLMFTINNDAKRFGIDVQVSEFRAGLYLDKFHNYNPKIREVFHLEVRQQLDQYKCLINPYGRVYRFFEKSGPDMDRDGFAYIPQSTVADHTKRALVGIKKEYRDMMICIEAHDAITAIVRHDEIPDVDKLVRSWFNKKINFSNCSLPRDYDLVIPTGCEVGSNLHEMRKLKKVA